MLNIADLSSNNKFSQQLTAIKENDGVIVKATEGKTYKNSYMKVDLDTALEQGKLIGVYHYARPENNSAADEALHFLETVQNYIGKAVLVLDWEGKALNTSQAWARQWLDTVYHITGVKPLLYVQESAIKKVAPFVQDGDYGLWVAKYSKKAPVISPWKIKAMWQYTDSPYDKSYFYGTKDTWKAYAKRGE